MDANLTPRMRLRCACSSLPLLPNRRRHHLPAAPDLPVHASRDPSGCLWISHSVAAHWRFCCGGRLGATRSLGCSRHLATGSRCLSTPHTLTPALLTGVVACATISCELPLWTATLRSLYQFATTYGFVRQTFVPLRRRVPLYKGMTYRLLRIRVPWYAFRLRRHNRDVALTAIFWQLTTTPPLLALFPVVDRAGRHACITRGGMPDRLPR